MDYGADGGFCEICPGITDQHCINATFITELGTAECQSVCVESNTVDACLTNAISLSLFLVCLILKL